MNKSLFGLGLTFFFSIGAALLFSWLYFQPTPPLNVLDLCLYVMAVAGIIMSITGAFISLIVSVVDGG